MKNSRRTDERRPFDDQDEDRDEPMPRDPDDIQAFELATALRGLVVLDDDPYLRMQAINISIVDKWLMTLETKVRIARFNEEKDYETEVFLSAITQMWLFAVYELLRTWRERAKDIQKWAANGGISLKIATLEKDRGFRHLAQEAFTDLLKRVAADPTVLSSIADDLARTHVLFGHLEFLRVALAKHEISGKAKQLAYAPGVGRIDSLTGSIAYELSKGRIILAELKRRDVADGLRSITSDRTVPRTEDIEAFEAFMRISPNEDPFGDSL
jgi:hypothetical protein